MTLLLDLTRRLADLGGPVLLVLLAVSILTLAVIFYKIWHLTVSRVGRHKAISEALAAWDTGDAPAAHAALGQSRSYLAPVVQMGLEGSGSAERLEAEAEMRLSTLERGFRYLDMVAQLAPLLGLFGTVLGMISAFQALQEAGAQVDPSILAGGIWVALLTTAAGLVVAMPTAMVLSWFEGRMEAERVFAARAIQILAEPDRHA